MAIFTYQGTGDRGERRSGELEAASRSEALRRLAMDRIQPLMLHARSETPGAVGMVGSGKRPATETPRRPKSDAGAVSGNIRLNNEQLILFTDELSDFLHSGLQLEPALQLIENREEKSPVKTVAAFLRHKVRDGTSFSDALKLASPSFGELYCNLVAAGEVSGALGPLLRRQSTHLIAMQELRGRVKLALIYPACLILFGLGAMLAFMLVLVPQMIKLLAKTNSTMPLPTYILIHLAGFMRDYGLILAAALGCGIAVFLAYTRQPGGRRWWDEAKLKIPLLGPLLSASFHAQFCQTMANLLQNGLPLLTTLKLVSRATTNVFHRALVVRLTDLVGEGISLTRAMKAVGHFPPNLRDLVKVGEQTGDLGGTMEKVGQRYDKIIQQRVERIMAVVPLIIITAIGGMVAFIAWSMMSGIFQTIHGLQQHH